MDQARWMIVFAVLVCMIFTLGLLHRFSRAAGPAQASGPASTWSAGPRPATDRQPTALPASPFTVEKGQTAVTVLPPPDFCYGTAQPEEVEGPFRQVADRLQSRPGESDRGSN